MNIFYTYNNGNYMEHNLFNYGSNYMTVNRFILVQAYPMEKKWQWWRIV